MQPFKRREFLRGSGSMMAGIAARSSVQARAAVPAPLAASNRLEHGNIYRLAAKPFYEVQLRDRFWEPVVRRNAQVTIPFESHKLEDLKAPHLDTGVLEAAIYVVRNGGNPRLAELVEKNIARLIAQPDAGPELRYFEVGAVLYHATGDRRLIDAKLEYASSLLRTLRQERPPFPGGERYALSCLHLHRVTGNPEHLELARYYLDVRGREDSPGKSRHNQSHILPQQQREAVGHAVNCVTLMLSLFEYGIASGDHAYSDAAFAMWNDVVQRKMYVTGGVGSTGNEGFGEPYDLPNISAYSETCAVLMWQNLNQRMFEATGDARYIDVMEWGMYNNMLSGIGLDGEHFFYVNRLASAGDGRDKRWQHAALECCPPNLVRSLARMPEMVFAQDRAGAVHVNLYVSSSAQFSLPDGPMSLEIESEMPWSGRTQIGITASSPIAGTIRLRVPGWARDRAVPGDLYSFVSSTGPVRIDINGVAVAPDPDAFGYVTLNRTWVDGDSIVIDLPVRPRRLRTHPAVHANRGRLAICRGPIVYCAEGLDIPDHKALNLVVAADAQLELATGLTPFPDAVLLKTQGRHANRSHTERLAITLIPYFLWANRDATEMTTWLLTDDYEVGDIGPAGGWIFYRNPNAAREGWRYLEAAPFDQSLGAKWGCFRREVSGAMGAGIGTGKTNTAEVLVDCAEPASAAHLCSTLVVNGIDGWFLPSRDELIEMYRALAARDIGNFLTAGMADNCEYWASTQIDSDMAAHVDFADNGRIHGDDKDFPRRVRAIRSF